MELSFGCLDSIGAH